MKPHSLFLSAVISFSFAISLNAQDQILPSVKNAADPFTRDGNPTSGSNDKPPEKPYMIYSLVEFIEVPTDDWLAYAGSHPVHYDATELRAEVQRWIVAGKAKPIEITSLPTKSGNRAVIESILERRYPIEYLPANPRPVPTTFETRNSHFTFEWEPSGDLGGKSIDSNSAANLVNYVGEVAVPFSAPSETQPVELTQPRFVNVKQSITSSLTPNVPVLLQVSTPSDGAGKRREGVRLLNFFRAAAFPIPEIAKELKESTLDYLDNGKRVSMKKTQWDELLKAAKSDPTAKAKADDIREQFRQGMATFSNSRLTLEVQRLEVKLSDLNAWYAGKPLETATSGLQAAAMEWVRGGRGRIVDHQASVTRSGNRSVWEDIHEVRYVTEYDVEGETPQIELPRNIKPNTVAEQLQVLTLNRSAKIAMQKDPAVSPKSFETRNTGYTVEYEPIIEQGTATVSMQIAVGDTKLVGHVACYQREVNGKMQTAIEQPIFATMKVSTNLSVTLGKPALLGINTPMEDDMKPSADRRILTFVSAQD